MMLLTMQMVTSAAAVTGATFEVLVVNVAATFTTLTDSSGQNMLSAASSGGHNLSGVSVAAGMIISANAGLLYRDWETDRKSTRLNSSH